MEKKKIFVADAEKLAAAKNELAKLRRETKVEPNGVLNVVEDMLNSFEEEAKQSDEEVVNKVLDAFKDGKQGAEAISKAIEDELAKRDFARQIVDKKNDAALSEKFANAVISSIENRSKITLGEIVKQTYGNDIQGLVFPTQVETAIKEAWEDSSRILAIFNRSQRDAIPYTTQDYRDQDVRARIHTNPNVEKTEQHLEVQYITLSYEYFYKLQYLRNKEIALARQNGTLVAIVAEIMREGTKQLINAIVEAALVTGASTNAGPFMEPVARLTSDAFVAVDTMNAATPTIPEVRLLADKVMGVKHLLCSSAVKTALETRGAGNATGVPYMSTDEMLAQVGCVDVITNETLGNMVIVLADQAYTIGGFDIETLRFNRYEYNKEGYLVEMLTAGAMRQLRGAACLLPIDIEITILSGTLTVTTGTIADGDYTIIVNNASEVVSIATGTGTTTLEDGNYRVISNGYYLSCVPA